MSRQDAAKLLGVSLDTFEEHVQPRVRVCKVGRRVVVPVKELEHFLDRHFAGKSRGNSPTFGPIA